MLEIKRESCVENGICLHLKDSEITQGNIYCDMSIDLTITRNLLIRITFFFSRQDALSGRRHKNTHHVLGLSNIINIRLHKSKQQKSKQTLWRAHALVLAYSFTHVKETLPEK